MIKNSLEPDEALVVAVGANLHEYRTNKERKKILACHRCGTLLDLSYMHFCYSCGAKQRGHKQ